MKNVCIKSGKKIRFKYVHIGQMLYWHNQVYFLQPMLFYSCNIKLNEPSQYDTFLKSSTNAQYKPACNIFCPWWPQKVDYRVVLMLRPSPPWQLKLRESEYFESLLFPVKCKLLCIQSPTPLPCFFTTMFQINDNFTTLTS